MIRKNPFRFHKTSLCQHQNNRSDIAFPLPVYTILIQNEIKFSESIKNRLLRLFVSRFLTVKTRKIRLSAAYVCCEIGLATADVICIQLPIEKQVLGEPITESLIHTSSLKQQVDGRGLFLNSGLIRGLVVQHKFELGAQNIQISSN